MAHISISDLCKPRFAALLVVYSSIPPIYTKEGDRSNILFRTPELSLPKRDSYLDATTARVRGYGICNKYQLPLKCILLYAWKFHKAGHSITHGTRTALIDIFPDSKYP